MIRSSHDDAAVRHSFDTQDLHCATLSSQARSQARTGGELLREFFGTLRAEFGILCPFRSHIRDSAAERESEEGAHSSRFVGAPEEIRTPDPQIRSLLRVIESKELSCKTSHFMQVLRSMGYGHVCKMKNAVARIGPHRLPPFIITLPPRCSRSGEDDLRNAEE
jgi:hypothetical protein